LPPLIKVNMPITTVTSDYNTVTSASQKLTAMTPGFQYILRGDVDLYYKVGPNASVTAAAADNSHFLPAGCTAFVAYRIDGGVTNDTVAVIRSSVDGACTLSKVEPGTA
jgi:hypothetical protein